MDAITLLKKDHHKVEQLFQRFERTTKGSERKKVVREIIRELSVHATVEEQLLYPMLRDGLVSDDDVLEALEEHHVVKVSLLELDKLPVKSERYAAKVRVMAEMVRHHVKEEERELLPKLKRLGAEKLRALGAAMERAKKLAPTRPHPGSPDEPPGNVLVGALMAMYDRSKDAVEAARLH